MTPREQDCLKAIITLSKHGVSPSYDEIAAQIGLAAKSGVHRLVKSLERQGLIEQEPHRKNAITVVADNPAYTPAALAKLSPDALDRLISAACDALSHLRAA